MKIKRALALALALCAGFVLYGCTPEKKDDDQVQILPYTSGPAAEKEAGEKTATGGAIPNGEEAPAALQTGGSEDLPEEEAQAEVLLVIENDSYPLETDEITYTIVNNLPEPAYVVLAPRLERDVEGSWVEIRPEGVGFCGTPDGVTETLSGILPLEWYGQALVPGSYRLSFEEVMGEGDFSQKGRISAGFELV